MLSRADYFKYHILVTAVAGSLSRFSRVESIFFLYIIHSYPLFPTIYTMQQAVPTRSAPNGGSRMAHAVSDRQSQKLALSVNIETSMVDLCRAVIVLNLERYSPNIFSSCDEEEWEAIIRLRHAKTQPKEGSGGLDGTGRIAPALSDKVLEEMEQHNPQIAESAVVDLLVWKDCTEFRFRRGGLTRPQGLLLPWPELVIQITEAAHLLTTQVTTTSAEENNETAALQTVDALFKLPMNVTLLQSTGAGKVIKRAIKTLAKQNKEGVLKKRLEHLLNAWMALASDAGVQLAHKTKATNNKAKDMLSDLNIAQTCQTWRQLFAALHQREDNRRTNQGKRMREIRRNLASDRPKVVKVRPAASNKQQRILARPGWAKSPPAAASGSVSKLSLVKREANQSRQVFQPQKTKASFGDAVAFSSGTSKKRKTTVLPGGKTLHTPNNLVSRQFASKSRKLHK
jgi:hypothetical protein